MTREEDQLVDDEDVLRNPVKNQINQPNLALSSPGILGSSPSPFLKFKNNLHAQVPICC
jgi:hypothetical protein